MVVNIEAGGLSCKVLGLNFHKLHNFKAASELNMDNIVKER